MPCPPLWNGFCFTKRLINENNCLINILKNHIIIIAKILHAEGALYHWIPVRVEASLGEST
jgi:hypothetical protein